MFYIDKIIFLCYIVDNFSANLQGGSSTMPRQDMHLYEVAKEVAKAVELLGSTKDDLSPPELGREINIIVRQVQEHQLEMKHVLAAGQSETFEEFLEALDNVGDVPDNVVCPICATRDGSLIRKESSPETGCIHPTRHAANQ